MHAPEQGDGDRRKKRNVFIDDIADVDDDEEDEEVDVSRVQDPLAWARSDLCLSSRHIALPSATGRRKPRT